MISILFKMLLNKSKFWLPRNMVSMVAWLPSKNDLGLKCLIDDFRWWFRMIWECSILWNPKEIDYYAFKVGIINLVIINIQ